MAGLTITLDDGGTRAAIEKARSIYSVRAILNAIGARHLYWINQNFRSHGIERPWAPLSPNTLANPRRGSGAQPLRDTGHLAQSFNDYGIKVAEASVEVGTNVRYAIFHEEGAQIPAITAQRGKALRFWMVGGVMFRKSVRAHALPARHMLPTQALAEQLAVETVTAVAERAVAVINTPAGKGG